MTKAQIVRTVATAIIAPLVVAAVVGIVTWFVSLQVASAAQATRIGVIEARHEAQQKQLDRMENKLDTLLERTK
jgi:hypothetical protein